MSNTRGTKRQRGGGPARSKQRVGQGAKKAAATPRIVERAPEEDLLERAYHKVKKTGRAVKQRAEQVIRSARRRVARST